jgi:trimethylamine-N-oxide reductase cytochrome c-type subunit TorC
MTGATKRAWTIGAIVVVGAACVAALFVGTALYTDRPQFCPSCHEMQPHYDAWAAGPHKDTPCIECHVAPGYPARFTHKFVALGEVWSHFFGNRSFPLAVAPVVPDSRCVTCHEKVPAKIGSFPHDVHAKKGGCAQCHVDTGHKVTAEALQNAGVFAPDVVPARIGGKLARVGQGSANLPGHPTVSCSECHDLSATPCSACHQPPHEKRGECSQCHRAAAKFEFSHPSAGEHSWKSRTCKQCHPNSLTEVYCTCHKGRPPQDD